MNLRKHDAVSTRAGAVKQLPIISIIISNALAGHPARALDPGVRRREGVGDDEGLPAAVGRGVPGVVVGEVEKQLAERMDALIVEGVNMGFDEKQMMELFRKRWQEILQTTLDKPGE